MDSQQATHALQHLLGTPFVPSAVSYMKELAGVSNAEQVGEVITLQARHDVVLYSVQDGNITFVAAHV